MLIVCVFVRDVCVMCVEEEDIRWGLGLDWPTFLHLAKKST